MEEKKYEYVLAMNLRTRKRVYDELEQSPETVNNTIAEQITKNENKTINRSK